MQYYIPLIMEGLRHYGYFILFFGAFFAGETFILAAAFLASWKYFNLQWVILVSLLAVLLSDSLWYFIGLKFSQPISRFRRFFSPVRYEKRIAAFKNGFNKHYREFLILGKFVYGARILTLLAAGHQKINYKKFLYYNFIGNIIWLFAVIIVGCLMGLAWDYLDRFNHYWRYLILVGLALLLAVRFVFSKIIKKLNYEPGS
ncbi:MAG: VTT domain-containing protein [Patescibacteria group bacterium]